MAQELKKERRVARGCAGVDNRMNFEWSITPRIRTSAYSPWQTSAREIERVRAAYYVLLENGKYIYIYVFLMYNQRDIKRDWGRNSKERVKSNVDEILFDYSRAHFRRISRQHESSIKRCGRKERKKKQSPCGEALFSYIEIKIERSFARRLRENWACAFPLCLARISFSLFPL